MCDRFGHRVVVHGVRRARAPAGCRQTVQRGVISGNAAPSGHRRAHMALGPVRRTWRGTSLVKPDAGSSVARCSAACSAGWAHARCSHSCTKSKRSIRGRGQLLWLRWRSSSLPRSSDPRIRPLTLTQSQPCGGMSDIKDRWFRTRPFDDKMRDGLEAHVAMRAEHDRVDQAACEVRTTSRRDADSPTPERFCRTFRSSRWRRGEAPPAQARENHLPVLLLQRFEGCGNGVGAFRRAQTCRRRSSAARARKVRGTIGRGSTVGS
jgi:hypothetical protein